MESPPEILTDWPVCVLTRMKTASTFLLLNLSITWVRIICGIAAIAGSIASVFMKFKGGKGVATAVGVFLALEPFSTLIGLVIWTLLFLKYRYVSLGSIVGATALPILIALFNRNGLLRYPVFYLAVLVARLVGLHIAQSTGRPESRP